MLFDNTLAGTDWNFNSVSSHEDSVLSHLIPQRSDLISVSVSCQAWIRSFHPGLVSSHPSLMPGWNRTGTGYSDFDSQSN